MSGEAFARTIEFYKTEDDKCPFIEWLDAQEITVRAKINKRLTNVGLGNLGDHHAEGEGVFALILDFGPGYRVYFGLTHHQKLVLLLVGGTKKHQGQDINNAHAYWKDYKAKD